MDNIIRPDQEPYSSGINYWWDCGFSKHHHKTKVEAIKCIWSTSVQWTGYVTGWWQLLELDEWYYQSLTNDELMEWLEE